MLEKYHLVQAVEAEQWEATADQISRYEDRLVKPGSLLGSYTYSTGYRFEISEDAGTVPLVEGDWIVKIGNSWDVIPNVGFQANYAKGE